MTRRERHEHPVAHIRSAALNTLAHVLWRYRRNLRKRTGLHGPIRVADAFRECEALFDRSLDRTLSVVQAIHICQIKERPMMMSRVFGGAVLTSVLGASASAGMIHATSVEYFDQWDRKDGNSVASGRSNPLAALGAPQDNDTMNFVSLGFGGTLILGFDQQFGGEFAYVTETTYGNPSGHPERVQVWVGAGSTWDSADWFLATELGNHEDDSPISLSGIGGGVFDFMRLTDVTDPSAHGGSADGFDVDGVTVQTIPTPGAAVLAGLGLAFGGLSRRRWRV